MSNKENTSNMKSAANKAGESAKAASEAAKGYFNQAGQALKSPTAKEVYKVVGYVAIGAVITGLTGFKIDIPGK